MLIFPCWVYINYYDYVSLLLPSIPYSAYRPQIPSSKLGVLRPFQVQTGTSQHLSCEHLSWNPSHQPFHPGLCVSLSRARLSRLRLTQQSLKRVGHEGKPCLKVEQRHPHCLSKVTHCLSRLGYPQAGHNRCHRVHHRPVYNLLYRDMWGTYYK